MVGSAYENKILESACCFGHCHQRPSAYLLLNEKTKYVHVPIFGGNMQGSLMCSSFVAVAWIIPKKKITNKLIEFEVPVVRV